MKMMGLEAWMLWLGWFIHSMVTNIISVCFITILLKVSFSGSVLAIFEYSNAAIIWLLMFLYCVSGVCYAFAVSTLFNKRKLNYKINYNF